MFKNLLLLMVMLLPFSWVTAQSNQILHLDRPAYNDIKFLQQRGYLLDIDPTNLPYTFGEVRNSLLNIDPLKLNENELYWYQRISDEIKDERTLSNNVFASANFSGGFNFNNSFYSDGLRSTDDGLYFLPKGSLVGYAERDKFAAQIGLSHDLAYSDEKATQNASSRYYVRSEDFYLGFNDDFIKIYAGRFGNHWAPYDELSTTITTNAPSFDRIDFKVGPSWFKVSSIIGELDNLDENGTFEGRSTINGIRRYLALHRIDISISKGVRISYFDGFLYSGDNARLSLDYLNPFNFFFFDRTTNPTNNEYNAFFGGAIWLNHRKVTFNAQGMIDDFQTPQSRTSAYEPITLAITSSLNIADVLPSIDLGYELELIGYQTYNTDEAEGRYLFLNRGIATQYNDYGAVKFYTRYHAHKMIRGLTITPSYELLAQGEQEIDQPFVRQDSNGNSLDVFITGTPEYTYRAALELEYSPNSNFWVNSGIGYNSNSNINHIRGNTGSQFTFFVETGFRLNSFDFQRLFQNR